ncbi:hypothetical protein [Kitasatospora sp. NPDC097691]|uniref:hypothetical protein n=1 Tax=Kitasatospora sp. NPDC097691 TaxID=3157231 RepID=UPI003324640B
MLVALYRSGPLRQRLAKGYAVVRPSGGGPAPAQLVAALVTRPPRLPALPTGQPPVLRASSRTPGGLWFDTGRVWLHDPPARAAVAAVLAEAVAAVAGGLRASGALLVPSGWHPGASAGAAGAPGAAGGTPAVLLADLHSLEVVDEVQRELLCNLLREHSPTLIALTGRQLYGAEGVPSGGSARLSRATDQVTTRYVASFAPQHLDRVRTALRQEERLARLEAMDVNPLGEAEFDAAGDVTLRLVDGQVSVSSAMAHALVVQALAMRARELARTGRRIGAVPQPLVERNRARAVAHGLAAGFEVEQQGNRRGGRAGGRAPDVPPRTVPAARAASALLRELLPCFRQLDATADELGQLFTGLELSAGSGGTGFVRNENDLLARWRQHDPRLLGAEQLADGLGRPGWLTHDHVAAANSAIAAGSSAAARVWLAEQLTIPAPAAASPSAVSSSAASRTTGDRTDSTRPTGAPERDRERERDRRRPNGTAPARPPRRRGPSDEQLLNELARPGVDAAQALAALRSYCRSGPAALDLTRALHGRDRDQGKALRRLLRPEAALRVRLDAPPNAWDDQKLAKAVRGATEQGAALLHWDVPAADRPLVRARLRELGPAPHGLRTVLLTDLTYTAKADERRGTVEVLLVVPAEEPAR